MSTLFDPNAPASPETGMFGLETHHSEAQVVLVPVPFEATTSYRPGTASGPRAILKASHQVDLFDLHTGQPYLAGIHLLPEAPTIHAWNLEARQAAELVIAAGGLSGDDPHLQAAADQVNRLTTQLNDWLEATVRPLIQNGQTVGVVGGDHSVSLGSIAAHAERWPGLGILHIDAHADLREAYEGFTHSHASIMYNVLTQLPQVSRLVQVAVRDLCEEERDFIVASSGRVQTFSDPWLSSRLLDGVPFSLLAREIAEALPQEVYVSLDIDGLDPSLCPHTGTPVPGGLSFAQTLRILEAVVASGRRIVGFDLVEVAPGDGDDWDANVGARVLYKLIGYALLSQGKGAPPNLLPR